MKAKTILRNLGKILLLFPIIAIGLGIAVGSLRYLEPDFSRGFLRDKAEVFDGIFQYGLYLHMLGTPLALFLGTSQAFFRYEWKQGTHHRWLGRVYAFAVIFLAAPGGLILAPYSAGGWWGKASFLLLGLLWLVFTAQGWSHARSKRWNSHRQWMIRSYLLTLSAVVLRIGLFVQNSLIQDYSEAGYALLAWLSWVPLLLIGEIFLRKSQK